jgi:hypothetical protein
MSVASPAKQMLKLRLTGVDDTQILTPPPSPTQPALFEIGEIAYTSAHTFPVPAPAARTTSTQAIISDDNNVLDQTPNDTVNNTTTSFLLARTPVRILNRRYSPTTLTWRYQIHVFWPDPTTKVRVLEEWPPESAMEKVYPGDKLTYLHIGKEMRKGKAKLMKREAYIMFPVVVTDVNFEHDVDSDQDNSTTAKGRGKKKGKKGKSKPKTLGGTISVDLDPMLNEALKGRGLRRGDEFWAEFEGGKISMFCHRVEFVNGEERVLCSIDEDVEVGGLLRIVGDAGMAKTESEGDGDGDGVEAEG